MSENAGFVSPPEKSIFVPTQKIAYLGFLLHSEKMTVKLTEEKSKKLKLACEKILKQTFVTIRQLSRVVGIMVASFPGVKMGQLFYRRCDNLKSKALKENKGNYEAKVLLTEKVREDLKWWIHNIEKEQTRAQGAIRALAGRHVWKACVAGMPAQKKQKKTGREVT
jgi:hypothetical protein